jgi:hypothetical protein
VHHANPDTHSSQRHGYYRAKPIFSEREWAAIEYGRAAGRHLEVALLMSRLRARSLLAYTNNRDLPPGRVINAYRLFFREINGIIGLVKALHASRKWRQAAMEPEWVTTALEELGDDDTVET